MTLGSHLEAGSFWRPATARPARLCLFNERPEYHDLSTGMPELVFEKPPEEPEPPASDPPYPASGAAEMPPTHTAPPPALPTPSHPPTQA